jgi:hypothetical protein
MFIPWNQLLRMVIVEDDYNNFEACTLGNVTTEYNRILWITPIFSHTPPQTGIIIS